MTLELGGPNRNVFYLNFETIGDSKDDREQICRAEQNFNFANLIENADQYILAIERFRLPLQGIPMLRAIPQAVQIIDNIGGGVIATLDLPDIYSINEFLTELGPTGSGWSALSDFLFNLTPGGQICIFGGWGLPGAGQFLRFDPIIAEIFDLPLDTGVNAGVNTIIKGASVVFDRFDELYKIQIVAEQGLSNIQQEIVTTNTFRNILTDFLIPSNWNASYSDDANCTTLHDPAYSLNYPVRQDLEFNDAQNRRWIFLRGGAPIQNVGIKAEAVLRDGTVQNIPLPPRSVFSAKLSFWLKG